MWLENWKINIMWNAARTHRVRRERAQHKYTAYGKVESQAEDDATDGRNFNRPRVLFELIFVYQNHFSISKEKQKKTKLKWDGVSLEAHTTLFSSLMRHAIYSEACWIYICFSLSIFFRCVTVCVVSSTFCFSFLLMARSTSSANVYDLFIAYDENDWKMCDACLSSALLWILIRPSNDWEMWFYDFEQIHTFPCLNRLTHTYP